MQGLLPTAALKYPSTHSAHKDHKNNINAISGTKCLCVWFSKPLQLAVYVLYI